MEHGDRPVELIAGRALVVPGVRKGVLRVPGTLLLTMRRLVFVPDGDDEGGAALRRGLDEAAAADADGAGERRGDDPGPLLEALVALIRRAQGDDEGIVISRRHPRLGPPDGDGRLRLLAVGEDDDLLVPVAAVPSVSLVIGEPREELDPLASWLDPGPSGGASAGAAAGAHVAEPRGGWVGAVSSGVAAVLALLVMPVLTIGAAVLAEEGDDEVAAVLFLFGAACLTLGHMGTFAGTAWSFARREGHRWWSLSTLLFAAVSLLVVLVGSLFALDELM